MQNMQLLGEFNPREVYAPDKSDYNGLSVSLPKKIQLVLWTRKCERVMHAQHVCRLAVCDSVAMPMIFDALISGKVADTSAKFNF